MPLIAYGKDDLNKLYRRVSPSIVSVNTYEKIKRTFNFFTGFIVYSERSRSVVCVHKSALASYRDLYVHFNDGTTEKATVLVEETTAGLAILLTKSSRLRPVVSFSQSEVKREDIFTITEVQGGYSGFNFLRGTIIAPCCEALLDENSKKIVPGSTKKFALSCPAKKQVLGAAVFDLEGWLVGIIISMDDSSYRLKFAQQACNLVDKLEDTLKGLDEKFSLSKKVKSKKRHVHVRHHEMHLKLKVLKGCNEQAT